MSSNPTRKAIYIGRRLGRGDKTLHAFLLLPDKKEIFFPRTRGVIIGHTYKCWATKMSRRPERTDDERIDNPVWDAADALVDAHNAKKRAETKARKNSSPALKAAVAALKPLVEKTNYIEQESLVRHLLRLARGDK